MSKVYNRVGWSFVEGVMRRLGFTNRWIQLILKCISSISHSILVNGSPNGLINPSCGIRQDDPLSLYLFIMCVEALSLMLQLAKRKKEITGVLIARGKVHLNHLFLADDSLLFYKVNFDECAWQL
jgi:hypothetical protein